MKSIMRISCSAQDDKKEESAGRARAPVPIGWRTRWLAGGFLGVLLRGRIFFGMLTHRRHRCLGVILAVFVFGPPSSLGGVMSLRHAVS